MNEIVVVVFNTILSEAILQSLSEHVDLALGFSKCIAVVTAVFLAFLGLETSVTSS